MNEFLDRKTVILAVLASLAGIALFLGLEIREEPDLSLGELALELFEIIPVVVSTVGVVLLIQFARRSRQDQLNLIRDLELARVQGQRWRNEARSIIEGLGKAIEDQFARWDLTEAEREVALLLLKGLSLKEIATVRATSERTIRAQARSIYGKANLTGRAALSAFFLEDLLAPIATQSDP